VVDEVSAFVDRLAAAADAQTQAALHSLHAENQKLRALLADAQGDVGSRPSGSRGGGATQFESVLEESPGNTSRHSASRRRVHGADRVNCRRSSARLGKAATVPEVLTALVLGLSANSPALRSSTSSRQSAGRRAAVGFELKADISKVAIPTTVDSLLTRALTSGAIESFVAGTLTKLL
jgi:hypothetical protein